MISFFQKLGFFIDNKPIKPFDYKVSDYKTSNNEKLLLHKEYLKEIEKEEGSRLNIIENKTSQIISQTGLIFSLLSLFIPFIIDKVLGLSFLLKAVFILILALAYLFYILTINNALKNFNVRKFNYVMNSPMSILNNQGLDKDDFLIMEIKDSLLAINTNIAINNLKASNLISAYNSFRVGNILTSILVIFLCTSLLFLKPKKEEIMLKNPIKVEQFNDYINTIEKQNKILEDKLSKECIIDTTTHYR